uniref:C962R-like N-terminal AEP domain-containing protein n=1 Tax=viral metagenome TaxID=1070528 RepID=A0A6C0C8N2_9ZZZZ
MHCSVKHAANYQLMKFLKSHICKDDSYTHTSTIQGQWHISNNELPEFYTLYSNAAQYFPMYIVEKSETKKPMPMIFEFTPYDSLHENEFDGNIFDNFDWTSMVEKIISIITGMFGHGRDFTYVFLSQENICGGRNFCFHFPYIVCEQIHHIMVQNILKNETQNVAISYVIDPHLYLSTSKHVKPYKIIKVSNDLDIQKMSIYALVNLLSVRNKHHLAIQPLRGAEFYSYPEKIIKVEDLPKINYDKKVIETLLKMIGKNRMSCGRTFRQMTVIFHYCHTTNINKDIDFYKIWKKCRGTFSGKHMWKYCNNFLRYDLNITSLYYYAHIDDPILFEKTVDLNPAFRDMLLQKNEK